MVKSFPKNVGYSLKYLLVLSRNAVFLWLLCLEVGKQAALGSWQRTVPTCVDHAALFSAARGLVGVGFLLFGERCKKVPMGAKI